MKDKEGFHKVGMYLPEIVWEAAQREARRQGQSAYKVMSRMALSCVPALLRWLGGRVLISCQVRGARRTLASAERSHIQLTRRSL